MKEFKKENKALNSKMIRKANYQREITPSSMKKFRRNFNPNLVKPICVSFRDGKYWVWDGQHTLAILKERNDDKDLMVDCTVYYGMTYEDEARAFAEQNYAPTKVRNDEVLRSLYESKDEKVLLFVETVEAAGFLCDFRGTGGLCCYKKGFDYFARFGMDTFADELDVLVSAYGHTREAVWGEMIGGLALFMHDYAGEYDRKRLIKCLSLTVPQKIVRDGKMKDYKGDRRYERVIFDIYNKRLGVNALKWKY